MQGPGRGGDQFLATVVPVVQRQARSSSSLTQAYYRNARALELPGSRSLTIDVEELPDEQVVAGLVAAGFKQLGDSLEAGHDLGEALEIAGKGAAGSAVRNAFVPGRRGIQDAHTQDTAVIGYYRVTAGDHRVCAFCSMLASRGAVFHQKSFDSSDPRFYGPGEVKVHDHCRCGFAPFFRTEVALPDGIQDLSDQWGTVTSEFSGNEKAKAWRRYWEAMARGEDVDLAMARVRRDADEVARLSVTMGGMTEEAA